MNILMIAYLFPPDSSSGAFRPMHFARHLDQFGEKIFVLTAREEDFMPYQTKDSRLVEHIGDHVEIFRSRVFHPGQALIRFRDILFRDTLFNKKQDGVNEKAHALDKHGFNAPANVSVIQEIKDIVTFLLASPDPEIGWLPSALRTGLKIIKQNNIDVIYTTGGPWTPLLIGGLLKKLTGKPLIMDFRDPWVTNPVFLLRNKRIQRLERWMESKVITIADHIVANTETLKQDFLTRYPQLQAHQVTTIPNGFEEYREHQPRQNDRLTLIHAGTLIFRNPKYLLQAMVNVIEQNLIPKDEIQIIFLGGISTHDSELDDILKLPILHNVVKLLGRLPYQEAVQFQTTSDVLFLMQPEEFYLQVPRKLYEYMAFRKPILGITNQKGATAQIIQQYDLGMVVPDQTPELEIALKHVYDQWKQGSLRLSKANTCDPFLNKNLTAQLRAVFQKHVLSSSTSQ